MTRPLGPNRSAAVFVPPRRPATKVEREARVARVELSPAGEVVAVAGQPVNVSAIPIDSNGEAVQGLAATWESSDPRVVEVGRGGDARAVAPGVALLHAKAGKKTASMRVVVNAASPRGMFGGTKKTSSRSAARAARPKASPTARGNSVFVKASYETAPSLPSPAAPFVYSNTDPLPDDETGTLFDPANDVGRPPGRTEPGAAEVPAAFAGTETPASDNFSISVPLVSLAGRGPAVSLALSYNSRIWHQSPGSDERPHLTYDVDSGWPAPGFRLGYGQLESQGGYGFTLTDPDGTRHMLSRRAGTQFDYDTSDGTFITFHGGRDWGTLTYADGTRVQYGAAGAGNRSYPVRVIDRDGNYLTISYVGGVGPRIHSIRDTLARYVRFHYEGNDLRTITVPKYGGGAGEETTVVRLYYGTINFSETPHATVSLFDQQRVAVHHPDTVRVLRYVNFPGTGGGYRYDYSGYGMIRQVVQLRAMEPSAFDLTPSAELSGDGQWAAITTYNYPQWAVPLAAAPTYTERTDNWTGRTSAQPVYTFADGANFSRVTAPDGTVTETTMLSGTGAEVWKNGLVGGTAVKAENGQVRARTRIEWDPVAAGKGQRAKTIWTTNEAGQTSAVVYQQYDNFNNPLVVSEHDFAADGTVGAELRRTETTYVTDANYLARRLFSLPQSVRVVDPATNRAASLVQYFYDETPLASRGAAPVEGHDPTYNPESGQYDAATAFRGHVTTVKAYPDAETPSAAPPTVSAARYDVLGNVVEQTVNCCRKKTFTYSAAYHYAYPEAVTRGDGAPTLSTGTVYDFNTGVVTRATNENEQETVISYDPETLRPSRVTRPAGGGQTDFLYHDAQLVGPNVFPSYTRETTVTTFESGRTTESHRYYDGRGALVRTLSSYTAAQGWVTQDVEYDRMGRAFRRSNPYYSAGETAAVNPSNLWTTSTEFDNLNRVTELTLPDGAKVHTSYAGSVMTTTDQAGRQRRSVSDALGRVREVHEPGADGSLGPVSDPAQKTVYDYDVLGNLTRVTQAGSFGGGPAVTQTRVFRYDSLSRLTHQRHVEAAARLDDGGTVSENGSWTNVVKYDSWGNVSDSYDSRGVHAHFEYDTLNRLKQVTYPDGAGTATPHVTYIYDQQRTDAQGQPYFNKGALTSLVTAQTAEAPATAQEYDYDRHGRVAAQRQTVGASTYALSYEYNLAGQLKRQTYPSGRAVTYAYDDAARLAGAASGAQAYASGLTYAAHGGITAAILGNGTSEQVQYNARLQPTGMMLQRGSGADAEVLQRYAYRYGRVDPATGAVDETKNTGQLGLVEGFLGGTPAAPVKQWEQRLSYDPLGRLSGASERRADNGQLAWQATYSYDRWGNRYEASGQSQHLPYVPVEAPDVDRQTNRFSPPTGNAPGVEYDHAGNVTRDGKFRARQYRYDANSRLVWSALLDGTGEARAVYDALGQRVRTTTGGQERVYVFDISGKVVAEYGAPEQDGGGTRYLFSDHQGSTRAVVDAQGQVQARRDYEPFGSAIGAGVGTRDGAGQRYGTTDGTRQQFALTEKDDATGLNHTWWRKYDNLAGRWTSPDPYGGSMSIGDPQSFNRYAFVGNDPVNQADPTGLTAEAPGCHRIQVGPNAYTVKCGPVVTVTASADSQTLTGGAAALALWDPTAFSVLGTLNSGGGGQDSNPCAVNTQLPAVGLGYVVKSGTSRSKQYGTQSTINTLQEIGEGWSLAYALTQLVNTKVSVTGISITLTPPPSTFSPIRVGDIGKSGGGQFPPHSGRSHAAGTGADIGLFRKDRSNAGTQYNSRDYDRETTQRFLKYLDAHPNVEKYYFNDPDVTGTKKEWAKDHHDHIHVIFKSCTP